MKLKLVDETVAKVFDTITEKRAKANEGDANLFVVNTWAGRTAVFRREDGYLVCELDELAKAINELNLIKETLTEVTGIEF